ncbi:uncharacterized protein J8A68_002027 [[Candida] subhashii]|uniref:Uncharacterized protein n=1 Tax=[Candida] subhashii TaxID=561895 RepID=A0A8J5QEB3_9ASCO|nr:uncharacterized protein J8A68_002027 [[Candida] subhashii]KAG7664424.1 hypothetical protein J8A68_002027 [[Candida] subhashii]
MPVAEPTNVVVSNATNQSDSEDSSSVSDEVDSLIDIVEQNDWEQRRVAMEEQRRLQEAMEVGSPFPHPWWSAFSNIGPAPNCLDEWLIIDISNSIRVKPDWERKYKDDVISNKWKQELRDQFSKKTRFIEEVIEFVFKELEWYEKIQSTWFGDSGFKIGCSDKIVYSDQVINDDLKTELKSGVGKLIKSFGENLDYHPGSNNQVLDLVHPSLFPLQYEKTPILDGDEVKLASYRDEIKCAKRAVDEYGVSKTFQWIPAVFKKENDKFKIASYINNLHPKKHSDLYTTIESIFNEVIPGLNYTLTRYASKEFVRLQIPSYDEVYTEELQKERARLQEELEDDDYDEWDKLEKRMGEFVKDFKPKWESEPVFDKAIDLKSFEDVKVIVKLANIELTPENPKYPGGAWHVEGTINEDIVATVLYYYEMENISDSRLSFRTGFEDPDYEQGDDFYTQYFFGLKDEDLMTRYLGSAEAKENRILIFPNMFQHHVDPFELTDKTKPGYRKILCFFIVDPYNPRVVGTDQVPPQQLDWWNDEELDYLFPNDLKEKIKKLKEGLVWPLTSNLAAEARRQLMYERSLRQDAEEYDGGAFTRTFSLCEH